MTGSRFDQAVVSERKIADYLLSDAHPAGRSKARYFMRFGFRPDDPGALRKAILEQAMRGSVISQIETQFGTKYIVEGPLNAPDRRSPLIRTVWIVPRGEKKPQFVTAYPTRWTGE